MEEMSFEIFESDFPQDSFYPEFRTKFSLLERGTERSWSLPELVREESQTRLPQSDGITARAERDDRTFSRKTKTGMPKWSSIFVRFNLNGADPHVPSIQAEKFLRFDGALSYLSELEKCRHDSMRFVSSVKVGTLPARQTWESERKSEMEKRGGPYDGRIGDDGRERCKFFQRKIDRATKLQIIRQPNLIHSYIRLLTERDDVEGNYSSRRCVITLDNIRLEMYRDTGTKFLCRAISMRVRDYNNCNVLMQV